MPRWTRGESDVEALLAAGELQKLTGGAANGRRLLDRSTLTLQTARSAVASDPDSAFVLAYDAARQALTALLAHQGLRPTTKAVTTPSNVPPVPSSGQGFDSSEHSAGAATSWSTPNDQTTMPPLTRRPMPLLTRRQSSTPPKG